MTHRPLHALHRPVRLFALSLLVSATLAACGGSDDDFEATPASLKLEKIGGYSSGVFGKSAAEIPAFDAASKRLFVVNAQAGKVDVLNLADPAKPVKIAVLDAAAVLAGAEINSVAVLNGIVAVAIQAPKKTDPGRVALYQASDLKLLGSATVGAQPDNVAFTPDGKTVLLANEGEPSDDYQTDPEGSVSVVNISDPTQPTVRTAGFSAFNDQKAALQAKGVRIYGPNATVAMDLEPEYIAVSADSKTAWVTLQENNALAKIDIATANVLDIVALGEKDHGKAGNELDVSDGDGKPELAKIDIRTWPGVVGQYLPDSIASYSAGGKTYLVTANEGDSRAWGEGNAAYWAGDATKGFVEEFRVKHLVHKDGFDRRKGDDLPPQLRQLAAGALLDPAVFGHCGAIAGDPKDCRADDKLGRLKITWTQGYAKKADGTPVLYKKDGTLPAAGEVGDRLMYKKLYSYGARSFSIWDEAGKLVWDSGAEIEKFIASDACTVGAARTQPCKTWFNSNHEEGNGFDNRSDDKGPEPEGIAVGTIGDKSFAFIGLERFGGVLVYDITTPTTPKRVDYLNTREDWSTKDPSTVLATVGDLGPEGLVFIPAKSAPNGKPLLVIGNEMSGTTAVFQVNLSY